MRKHFYIIFFTTLLTNVVLQGQSQGFIVKPTPFSSSTFDEFSPVFYEGGIVFCSNQSNNSLVSYQDEQSRLFKICLVTKKDSTEWKYPKLFSKELTSDFNDGPVTFSKNGNFIYYSRNNSIKNLLRNISDTSNKLGIYSAEFINGIWTNIKPFTHNNQSNNFCTPSLDPDGSRIYFSSDMPGGSGGMDLYYCDWRNDDWDQPVNLGPVVNTQKNESFPFAGRYGRLYFASDGHNGLGGKDLFYTREINGDWIAPVHLDSAINSPADDFGLVADSTFKYGYFSTNRRKSDDIFSFSSPPVEFASCDTIKEDNYCFTFFDELHSQIDTIPVIYRWDFGNGIVRTGPEVSHCFPGPGEYSVMLTIIDELTGNVIADKVTYKAELENIKQPYINSYNVSIVDKPVFFDGQKINLIDFRVTDYLWNFGDGFNPGAPFMSKTFKNEGEYTVRLGLLGEEDTLGLIPKKCVMKKIRIYDNLQELTLKGRGEESEVLRVTEPVGEQSKAIPVKIYLTDDLPQNQNAGIKEVLNKSGLSTLKFDQYGVTSSSYQLLDNIAGILKENPDTRLEIAIHATEDRAPGDKLMLSEKWAQELSRYFKTRKIGMESVRCKGFSTAHPVLKPSVSDNITIDGIIELIFMKK